MAYQLGHLGSAGIAVGVSLHDSAIATLRRFGKSDYLKDICEQAIRGEAVLCIGASEESGGSDLQICETEVRSARGGFEVRGVKKFVSLSPSPTTSWWWRAASTTTRAAGTATSC